MGQQLGLEEITFEGKADDKKLDQSKAQDKTDEK